MRAETTARQGTFRQMDSSSENCSCDFMQNLFGVFGMILFIPLTSVVYTLLKNDTNRKLKKKAELAQETVGTDSEPHQTE